MKDTPDIRTLLSERSLGVSKNEELRKQLYDDIQRYLDFLSLDEKRAVEQELNVLRVHIEEYLAFLELAQSQDPKILIKIAKLNHTSDADFEASPMFTQHNIMLTDIGQRESKTPREVLILAAGNIQTLESFTDPIRKKLITQTENLIHGISGGRYRGV